MAKQIIGMHVNSAYTVKVLCFSLFPSKKECPAQKETNIDTINTKSVVKANRRLNGNLKLKSSCWYRAVGMERNENKEVMGKNRAISEE